MVDLICGFWHLDDRPAAGDLLKMMARAMSPPDQPHALSTWFDGSVGLARLSVGGGATQSEISQGASGRACVGDARLYNRDELAKNLGISPGGGTPRSDERLALDAFDRYGVDAATKLDGDFAFAVWDSGARRLTCFRDHVGVRPFFYSYIPGRLFAFSSLARGLHVEGIIDAQISQKAVLDFYVHNLSDHESTFHDGVKRLPAAHSLVVERCGISKRRYWQLKVVDPISASDSFEDHAERLRDLVREAVERRVPKTGQVGAHMSGGLDSTSISVLAARALNRDGRRLETYSFVTEPRDDVDMVDERPYVDLVMQREPNIDNVKITPPQLSEVLSDNLAADRPLATGFNDPEVQVARHAGSSNVDVVLSGWGGDEVVTFNGRGVMAEYLVRLKWRTLYREAKALMKERGFSAGNFVKSQVLQYLMPDWVVGAVRKVRGRENASGRAVFGQYLSPLARTQAGGPSLVMGASSRANRLALINSSHIPFRLENWAYTGADHGFAYAFPLLDVKLLTYAIRIPAEFCIRDGFKRALFRQAMDPVLPETVRTRHEKFAPFPCILLRMVENKPLLRKRIRELREQRAVAKLFDFEQLEAAIDDLPSIEDVKKALTEEAAGGEPVKLDAIRVLLPLVPASFIERNLNGANSGDNPASGWSEEFKRRSAS